MKYPKSKKSCKLYADWLSKLHSKEYIPIEHPEKERGMINFAAVTKEELPYYLMADWQTLN